MKECSRNEKTTVMEYTKSKGIFVIYFVLGSCESKQSTVPAFKIWLTVIQLAKATFQNLGGIQTQP